MTKLLPDVFSVSCPGDCWLVVASASWPSSGRTLERRALRLDESGALTVAGDDIPLVPEVIPPRRKQPRWR